MMLNVWETIYFCKIELVTLFLILVTGVIITVGPSRRLCSVLAFLLGKDERLGRLVPKA